MKIDNEMKKFLEGVEGVIEATSAEKSFFWEKFHFRGKVPWFENLSGFLEVVGYFHDNPTAISLLTAVINDKKILFWHPTSQVVDHRLIDAWFKEHLKGIRKTDSSNPHIVIQLTKEQYDAVYPD